MEIYAKEPQRALQLIDSAEVVGNVSEFRAELLRSRVYAYPNDAMNLDTARQMGLALLEHDSVKASASNRMEVLRLLTDVARVHLDYPEQVKWASELATLSREQGDETEALRTESEIGIVLTHLGQRNEGFQMLDRVIGQLDGQRHFAELDACIIAMKRKLTALSLLPDMTLPGDSLNAEQRNQDIIQLAERFIAKLDDYEQHPQDYADGSARQPSNDEVAGYCDFYRSQTYVFLAQAYASSGNRQQAREYCDLFEQTPFGQTLNGRSAISETWRLLGDYDKMLATYDEIDRVAGDDTLGTNYIRQLRGRAEAAAPRGDHMASQQYWRRHDLLSQAANDQLQASEAHDYAARYHAYEQQIEIQQRETEANRNAMLAVGSIIFALFAIGFAVYYFRQQHIIQKKNRALTEQITVNTKMEEERHTPTSDDDRFSRSRDCETEGLTPEQRLFREIRDVVVNEQLYLDLQFGRNTIIERFHLSKDRVGAVFSQGSDYDNLSDFITDCRLNHARRLLVSRPDMSIVDIAAASGFGLRTTFTRSFKQKYSLTPTEFRSQQTV